MDSLLSINHFEQPCLNVINSKNTEQYIIMATVHVVEPKISFI